MIVLDASVILKWLFLAETNRDKAIEIMERHLTEQDFIAVPDLLPYEITNVLATKANVSEQEALAGISQILSYELEINSADPVDHAAMLRLSRAHHISVYDAAYVHLAQKLNCPLITADEKLYEKTKSLPGVRLLQ